MLKTYEIEYDFTTLATVEIEEAKAAPHIKEMVNFWSGSEDRLAENGGNYTTTWLKQLGRFILRRRRKPDDDEGWVPMDGTWGIKITSWEEWEPDEDSISIELKAVPELLPN